MRMRAKPTKPVRCDALKKIVDIYDGMYLSELLKRIPEEYRDSALIEKNYDYGYNSYDDSNYTTDVVYTYRESEEDFITRMKAYEVKIASYNKWAELYKDEIVVAKKDKAARAKASKLKRYQKEKAALEKAMAKLEKGMSK